jgi:hypothetical protein
VPVVFAHLHVGAAQLTLDDVPFVVAGERTHIGQWYVGQQVIGSVPSRIGVDPSGQATTIAGQRTALGSQVGFAGTHCPVHVWPEQLPFASHLQVGSVAGQAQVGGVGGTLVPPSTAGVGAGWFVPFEPVDGAPPVVVVPPSAEPPPVEPPPVVVVPPATQPQPLQLTWHI